MSAIPCFGVPDMPNDEVSKLQQEEEKEPLTFKERARFFLKALGYGTVSVGAFTLLTYHCIQQVRERFRGDHVKELQDTCAEIGIPVPEDHLLHAQHTNSADFLGRIFWGSLPAGFAYFVIKNKLVQYSIENFKKALQ